MLLLEAARVQEIANNEKKEVTDGQPNVVSPEIKAAKADYVAYVLTYKSTAHKVACDFFVPVET